MPLRIIVLRDTKHTCVSSVLLPCVVFFVWLIVLVRGLPCVQRFDTLIELFSREEGYGLRSAIMQLFNVCLFFSSFFSAVLLLLFSLVCLSFPVRRSCPSSTVRIVWRSVLSLFS